MRPRGGWKLCLAFAWLVNSSSCGPAAQPRVAPPEEAPALTDAELRAEYRAVAHAAYAKGVYLREQGELLGALQRFSEAVRLSPEDVELRVALVRLQLDLGRVLEAGQFLQDAIKRFGGSAEEHLLLARLHMVAGRETSATMHLDAALAFDPHLAPAWLLRGRLLYGIEDYAGALDSFQHADSLEPDRPATLTGIGDCLRMLKRDPEAEAVYRHALRLDPGLEDVRTALAEILRRTGRPDEAGRIYREALEENPSDGDALDALLELQIQENQLREAGELLAPYHARGELEPRQVFLYGRILLEQERYAEADSVLAPLAQLEGVRGIEPLLGEIALRQERFADARTHFQRAVKQQPTDCSAWVSLGLVMAEDARLEGGRLPASGGAVDSLRTVLAAAGKVTTADEYRCNLMLGVLYSRLREYDSALQYLLACQKLDPENPDLLFNLAMTHQELGHFETALGYGRDVLAIEPDNAAALNFVGYILAERGLDLESSEQMIRRALVQEPDNGYFVDSLGWVFYQMGDYQRAAIELERAVQLTEENDSIILEHLGDAYVKMGRLDGAYRIYQQSRALDPDNPDLLEKIGRLQEQLGKP